MYLAGLDEAAGTICPKCKDKQRGIAISPALGQRLLEWPARIQPDKVLIAKLHDIGSFHHLAQPLNIGVPITDKGRPYIGIE